MKFEWDAEKADRNYQKHGIHFSEAKTVFNDPLASIFDDPGHSIGELREIIVGYSNSGKLLLVSFTDRKGKIRIISARLATKAERYDYEENNRP